MKISWTTWIELINWTLYISLIIRKTIKSRIVYLYKLQKMHFFDNKSIYTLPHMRCEGQTSKTNIGMVWYGISKCEKMILQCIDNLSKGVINFLLNIA